jgi:hypothetical protein
MNELEQRVATLEAIVVGLLDEVCQLKDKNQELVAEQAFERDKKIAQLQNAQQLVNHLTQLNAQQQATLSTQSGLAQSQAQSALSQGALGNALTNIAGTWLK